MEIPEPHPDEAERLAALRLLSLLDTPPTEEFDRLTRLAARLLGTPIALISLVDEERQWFLSRVGLDAGETPRDVAFCAHAILQVDDPVLVVGDAHADLRFADNPLVTGETGIRFYAGHVVRDPAGMPIGTLCVIDRAPHELDAHDRTTLGDLAALVEAEIDRHARALLLAEVEASERGKALILETMSEGTVLQDLEGRIIEWNPAAEALLGLSGDELSGRTSTDPRWRAVHEDGSPFPGEAHPAMAVLRTGEPVTGARMGVHHPDGELVWLEIDSHPVLDDRGATIAAVTRFVDRTAWLQLESDLRHSRQVAMTSLDALVEGVLLVETGGVISRINPAAERILGMTADELSRRWVDGSWATWSEHGDEIADLDRPIFRAVRSGEAVLGEIVQWERGDGRRVLLRLSVIPLAETSQLVITFDDVTEERLAAYRLERLGRLFERSEEVILVADETGRILDATPSRRRILPAFRDEQAVGRALGSVHPEDLDAAIGWFARVVAGSPEPGTFRLQVRDAGWRWFDCSVSDLRDDPAVEGIVIAARDVTAREELQRQLAHAAGHDDLTDLVNRRVLTRRLDEAMARAVRDDRYVAVCFIDLDGFKALNDAFGHATGDEVLKSVAAILRRETRGGDTVARVGGDEFVVLLDGMGDPGESDIVVQRLRSAIEELSIALPAGVHFGASIGIAVAELDDTAESILARADREMYRTRAATRGAV